MRVIASPGLPAAGRYPVIRLTRPGRWRQTGLAAIGGLRRGWPAWMPCTSGRNAVAATTAAGASPGAHGGSYRCCGIAADLGGCQSAGDADHELRIETSPRQNRTICA